MTVKTFEGFPKVFSYASILEDQAREQLLQAGSLPFVFPHVVGEADMHWGRGGPVGLVLPTRGVICPGCVGVDIGCGMIAACTNLMYDEIKSLNLRRLRERIEKVIPMAIGPAGRNTSRYDEHTDQRIRSLEEKTGSLEAYKISPDWPDQLGTLGRGNHFFEFCRDSTGRVWIFIHSGSRGVGNRFATKHLKIAQALCTKWWITLPNPDLAYLVEGTPEFSDYMRDLHWSQHFAQLNREEMLNRGKIELSEWYDRDVVLTDIIRCHHNYTEVMPPDLISQFRPHSTNTPRRDRIGGNVWLTRKGAIDASLGKRGLLPGSMGGKSYITVGKGDTLGLWSAPHGAGRIYGRRQANSLFDVYQLRETMAGVEWSQELAETLRDEISYAYKPIDQVFEDSRTLIDVEDTLVAFVNIKGA